MLPYFFFEKQLTNLETGLILLYDTQALIPKKKINKKEFGGTKMNQFVSKTVGVAVGTAVPILLFSAALKSSPLVGGPAIMHALKVLGRGSAQRGIVVLAGSGTVSGIAAETFTDKGIKKTQTNQNDKLCCEC